jgi:hypothetical protein
MQSSFPARLQMRHPAEQIMNAIRRNILKVCALALFNAAFVLSTRANLIIDGGFELPVTGPGGLNSGYLAFGPGSTFGGSWLVIGPAGNVAVTPSTEYTTIGGPLIYFLSQEGSQSLDLTGEYDAGLSTGVQQTIPTVAGQLYSLSFYVGAVNTPDWGPSAGSAIINVLLNGNPFQTAINSDPTGDATQWKLFNYNFTAAGASTTLAFVSGSPAPIGENGLDNIIVEAVPEPAALSILLPGSLLLWRARRKWNRQ